ncbi:hypothetical protein M2459_001693 [Parabacteroides sp. PF5-5]|nr:hypothetical protein [Parabacteroides sp. PH5-39]MDH6315958.1 hypothetical protein [Parabacteroides sp. PF5-13]MDH6319615.1 hypothetical protein [Parabacteroides sp. PH5-13]MDH6323346.1 hypothetical protein [Parabacteroides sp. PH5-8]MDH6327145.1 hypothetical protein [Parabacteroides sp. PH5-41]MDH6334947.1 hypothetical protein [Parabacteroides sp. PF5-5]MDH6346011.1 hypothetical protein [Parabacteroides sp. PH5-46]MDH6360971.1 hypothetical protein [Parabacteroides sp. PH5-16]MDH6376638.
MKNSIDWKKHWVFNWVFFKSNLFMGLVLGLGFGVYQQAIGGDGTLLGFVRQCLLAIPLGFLLSFLYKEFVYKEGYYFYYNQGILKVELWIVSFILSCFFYLIFKLIHIVWMIVLR